MPPGRGASAVVIVAADCNRAVALEQKRAAKVHLASMDAIGTFAHDTVRETFVQRALRQPPDECRP
jgi:hypothetical protein